MLIAVLFKTTTIIQLEQQKVETSQMSVHRWMESKTWSIHTLEYYSAWKRSEIPTTTTWMILEDIMLNEISQAQNDNYYMFHWYEVPRAVKNIDTESKTVVARGWGRRE